MTDNTMSSILVTTDNDYFNSADEGRFFVRKGEVKSLPKSLTHVIEDALNQGLIREATASEIEAQLLSNNKETAIREGRLSPDLGRTAEDTRKLKHDRNDKNSK